MARHPGRSMSTVLVAVTAVVLLAAALGGAISSWVASYGSMSVPPDPTAFQHPTRASSWPAQTEQSGPTSLRHSPRQ